MLEIVVNASRDGETFHQVERITVKNIDEETDGRFTFGKYLVEDAKGNVSTIAYRKGRRLGWLRLVILTINEMLITRLEERR
jgi:hypothetical protein